MNTTTAGLKATQKSLNRKGIAAFLAFFLMVNQAVMPAFAQYPVPQSVQTQEEQREKEVGKDAAAAAVTVAVSPTTTDFLQEDAPLSVATSEESEAVEPASEAKSETNFEVRDYSESSFEDAVAELSKDYASAVVVKNFSADDLQKLTELDIEVGIAVLRDKAVLFTTGSEDELRANTVARALLDQADLIVHTHPAGQRTEASLSDIEAAGDAVEFVITTAGVVAYSHDGLVRQEPYAFSDLSEQINALIVQDEPSTEAREVLNRFILAIDEYNQDKTGYETYRSGDPITVLPNKPYLSGFASDPAYGQPKATISIDQLSTSVFITDYDVTNNGSFGGSVINFGTPGNFSSSAITKFTFGMLTNNICTGANDCVKVEFVDSSNRLAAVRIQGLSTTADRNSTAYEQRSINKSTLLLSNPSINFGAIKQINFVIDHAMAVNQTVGFLKIQTAGLWYQPNINPDPSNPAVTYLPVTSSGALPELVGFAKQDTSTSTVTMVSRTFGTINMSLKNADSYGGAYISYDNFGTAGTVETANFQTAFPGGISLRLDNGGSSVTQVRLELTDKNLNRASVMLKNVLATGQTWKFDLSKFDGVDLTQVIAAALVVDGQYLTGKLNVDWGQFGFVPKLPPDLSNPPVTPVPATSTQNSPNFTSFVTADGSAATATLFSPTFARLDMNLLSDASYGGAFIDYDNKLTTGTVETINLNTAFPSGIVLGLDNGGTNLTEILLEVTDINNKKDSVILTQIEGFGKRWKILASQFDDVDVTKIQTFAIVLAKTNLNVKLNIDWGNFNYNGPDATNPTVTTLPLNSAGQKPEVTGFASQGDPAGSDPSTSVVTMSSETFARVDLNLAQSTSYGGVFVNYDNFGTTGVETINLNTLYPSGMVFGLDNRNPSTGASTGLTEIYLEVTDANENRASVLLQGIQNFGQHWKILPRQFVGVDLTRIRVVAFVLKGQNANKILNIDWGNFAYTPSVTPDTSNPTVTLLPLTSALARPEFTGFAVADGSTATTAFTSATQVALNLNLLTKDSYGGAFINYDSFATTTTTETINLNTSFPNGIVFELDNLGTGLSTILLEVTDKNDKKDSVRLTGIDATSRRWKVATNLFNDVDVTKIKTLAFVLVGQYANAKLNVNWGEFQYTPVLQPVANPADYTISVMPVAQDGNRPNLNALSSFKTDGTDWSSANVTMTSKASALVDLYLFNTTSFGGVYVGYSLSTDPAKNKTINLNTLFPLGLTVGLDNQGTDITEVSLEVTDVNDKMQSVTLAGVTNTLNKWNAAVTLFDQVDRTQIKTVSLVVKGLHPSAKLNVQLGDFPFTPVLTAVPNPSDYTVSVLPVDATLRRPNLNALASYDPIKGDWSSSNVTMTSKSSADVDLYLYNTTSFGGVYVGYSLSTTEPLLNKTINLNTLYPGGLTVGLDNMGTDVTEVYLEVTDIGNKQQSVLLGNVENFLKKWNVAVTLFDAVDRTQIKTVSLVVKGRHPAGKLHVELGDFAYTPVLSAVTNPDAYAISVLPVDASNSRPNLNALASYDPTNGDWSSSDVTMTSMSSADANLYLFNTTSFGGVYVGYSLSLDAAKNKTIDLDALYPGGLTVGLNNLGSDVTEVYLEVTDIGDRQQSVVLSNVQDFLKKWNVAVSLFDQVDRTQIKTVSLVVKGRHTDGKLHVELGNFAYTPIVSAVPNPDAYAISVLPVDKSGNRPNLNALASYDTTNGDWSASSVTMLSKSAAIADLNLFNTTSFGGVFIGYSLSTLPAENKTINLNTLYPGGLTVGLDNMGTDVTEAYLEVTDVTGKQQSVLLHNIQNFLKKWNVAVSLFDQVDRTQIKTVSLVVKGRHPSAKLAILLGDFAFIESASPLPATDTSAVTPLPLNYKNAKPEVTPFASQDDSTSSMDMYSQLGGTLNVHLAATTSYGGMFVSYDDFTTAGTKETANFATAFADGIVFKLDNAGTSLNSVQFEVTDINNKRATVILNGMTSAQQRWKVLLSQLDGLDLTQITTVALVVAGWPSDVRINMEWGNFTFTPTVNSLAAGDPAVVTPVPVTSSGFRPRLAPFVSVGTPPLDPDTSTIGIDMVSETFAVLNMDLKKASSFGGAYLAYDNLKTTGVTETINFNTAFPGGIVLSLDNGGTGIGTVILEVTDINNKKDQVLLKGVESFGKKWKIVAGLFDDVDVTQIKTISLVVTGQYANAKVNVDWGNFALDPVLPPTAPTAVITPVPTDYLGRKPVLTSFINTTANGSSASVRMVSQTFAVFNTTLTQADSYSGVFANYDDSATAGTVETIDLTQAFPAGIVLGLDSASSGLGQVILEVTDRNDRQDFVTLNLIESFGKKWLVLPNQFDEVDVTHIKTLTLLVKGVQANAVLNIDWGNFYHAPEIMPLPAGNATPVTPVPLNSQTLRPALNAFASLDNSTAAVTMSTSAVGTIALNLVNGASYGGAFIDYDNAATTPAVESINLNTTFPSGIVLQLDNAGTNITSVTLELKDAAGLTGAVILQNVSATAQKWAILPGQFSNVDLTHIRVMSLVVTGQHVDGRLNLTWGNFSNPLVLAPLANPAAVPVSTFPVDGGGLRPNLNAFASFNPGAGDWSSTNVTMSSPAAAAVDLFLFNDTSYGGVFFGYSLTGTALDRTIDLQTLFPDGIIVGLDNAGTDVTQVDFEVTDAANKTQFVTLNGVGTAQNKWRILSSYFDQLDVTHVKTIALVVKGRHPNAKMNVQLGNFSYTPAIAPAAGTPAITLLPNTFEGTAPSLDVNQSSDDSTVTRTTLSATQAQVDYNLKYDSSWAAVYVNYLTQNNTDHTINLNTLYPGGITFGLDNGGTNLTQVVLEVQDYYGKKDKVVLTGISATAKRWTIPLSSLEEIDLTKVAFLTLVVSGNTGPVRLNIDWGNFYYIPVAGGDGSGF
ncbi:MAG: hypothetical protein WCU74_08705 [Candidatus Omnitrophota bacterium]